MATPARSEAAAALPGRIAFLGLGLIGGSIARGIRDAGYAGRLAAWTPNGRGPAEARRLGIVDEAATTVEEALDGAGLVVLAGPPLAILDALGGLAGAVRDRLASAATITDVASTKARIVCAADAAALPFVGGHPMAGRDSSGVESATRDLFVERPWVVVPGACARPDDVARVELLAAATGARPLQMDAVEHDEAVAAISHLPLVVAAALVESVAAADASGTRDSGRRERGTRERGASDTGWATAQELAASGWRDMTRLANGDPDMGAGILTTNAPAVAARLRALRDTLDAWIEQLDRESDRPDPAALRARLESARAALTIGARDG